MQNGKGPQLRKGANLKLYDENYIHIKGFKSNESKTTTTTELSTDAELSANDTKQSDEDLSIPHPD